MAKANKKSMEAASSAKINTSFLNVDRHLADIAQSCATIMPLVSDSLEFTRKIVRVYQTAFGGLVDEVKKQEYIKKARK